MKNKKGQEEFVGFGLIIIVVAVILLIFLSFVLKKNSQKEYVESYEVESFIQSALQYTTDCEDNLEFLSIQKVIFSCIDKETCLDKRSSCDVLNETLKEIVEKSWRVEKGSTIQGYKMQIIDGEQEIISIKKGNETKNNKGSKQHFSRGGNEVEISFTAYY